MEKTAILLLSAGPDDRHHDRYGSWEVVLRHSCAWLVLLVTMQLALCPFSRRQAQSARHQGRYGSEGQIFRDAVVQQSVGLPCCATGTW